MESDGRHLNPHPFRALFAGPSPVITKPPPVPNITQAVHDAGDRIIAARVVKTMIREGSHMSLLGKMQALTESAADFNKDTESALDGIAAKIAEAKTKREAAVSKHHGYYDGIVKAIEDSTTVIDRLSNGPLS
jgi:hypothetical protein